MIAAERIVDIITEGRKDTFSRLIQQALTLDTATEEFLFNFAFGIGVSINEDEIDTPNINWAYETGEATRVEHHMVNALAELGIRARSEGHTGDGDLVGSALLYFKAPEGVDALKFMEKYLQGPEEPMRTSSGTLPSFFVDKAFSGIQSEVIKRHAEITLTFWQTETLEKFFELVHTGLSVDSAILTLRDTGLTESFLGAPEPSGVFRSDLGGRTVFSAKCPGCRRIHGNFRTFEQASSNKMCLYCIRDYVDKISKVRETGNFKSLLKKNNHDKARR